MPRRPGLHARRLRFEQLEDRIALTIVAGGDGSQNTTPPTDDPGFANIGIRGSGSAVYLGDGWVLTATHVGAGATWFNGTLYNAVANSAVQLLNPPGAGYTTTTDLTLYQIDGRPDLPSVSIGSAAPAVGWNVIMIGNGRDRQSSEVYWTSSWQPSATPSSYAGYLWNTSMQNIRWGTNVISQVGFAQGVDTDSETAFATQFTANVANEGTGSWGDSGGGVFHKDASGNWQLVGIMFSISTLPGEPIGASAFGDITYMADLSVYRSQILNIIGVDHAPVGTSNTITVAQGASVTFTVGEFGFSDPSDSPANNFAAVKVTSLPALGTLTDNGTPVTAGQFVSVADIAANKLVYTISSNPGGASSTAFTFQVEDDGSTAGGGVNLDPSPKTMTLDLSHDDLTPPTVAAVTPLGASTGVSVNTPVTVTFSEAVNPSSVTTSTIQLRDSNNNLVAGTVTYNAATKTATLTPTSSLSNSMMYMMTIVGGAGGVTDLAGNSLATNIFSSFTTVAAPPPDTTPPTVVSVTPIGASTGVATSAVVTVTFSEALNVSTVNSGTIQLRDSNGNLVSGTVSYNAATKTATFTPTSALSNSMMYMLTVVGGTGGVTDLAGNALATNIFSSFTTVAGDTTPPTVVSVTPLGASTGVSVNTPVTVTFSEALSVASVTTNTIQLRDANNNLVAGTVTYNTANFTATFTPSAALSNSTTYMLTIVGGAGGVTDVAGNALATNIFSSFTTVAGDTTPPTVVAVTPVGASTGVAVNTPVTVAFSEALNPATISTSTFQLRDSNNNLVAATVAYSSATKTVILTPTSALSNSMTYMLTVVGGTGGVTDLAGNALATNIFSSFTTVAGAPVDTTPPTVVGVIPIGASTGVAVNAPVIVRFSEPLNGATISGSTFQLRDANNNLVPTSIAYTPSTNTVVLTPTSVLANSMTYMLTIVGGASGVKDLAGNAVATNIFSSFTTVAGAPADTTPPTVVAVTPVGASTGVAVNTPVTVKFSEALNPGTITASTFQLRDSNNNLVATTIAYSSATNTVILTPTSALANSMTYMLTVVGGANGVKDVAGNAVATNIFSSFTTVAAAPADTTPPTIVGVIPVGASSGVAVSASVIVRFSEALNEATISNSTFQLRDANNNLVATSISYTASTNTVILTPTSALANSMTYMLTVVGGSAGVKDLAGNALAANTFSSFTTVAAPSATSSLWPASTVPTNPDSGENSAIEVGVKFTASTNGYVTGIEFYKAAANTGTHTGSLWSSTGQLLATGTFTNETASGWQTLVLNTPVAITAGTTYVASYHTTVGHYAFTHSYFSAPYSNGALNVPVNGGVYVYGNSAFPTQSYLGTNYWVDVLFTTVAPVDTTPPTIVSVTPTGASTNVPTTSPVSIAFSEALSAASVTTNTIQLRDANNNLVAGTVGYNATNNTVTFTPTSALAYSTTYVLTVVGGASGVKDLAGNALASNIFSSFTTAGAPSPNSTLWSTGTVPSTVDSGDGQAVELGVKFTATANGYVTGVEFYKAAANTGTHTGSLWSSTGQLLATGTFTNETASGWQTLTFASPVAITAGTTYVAGYYAPAGHYSVTRSYFTSGYTSGSLQVLPSGGVYMYGSGAFPTQSYQASNYWVDVLFTTIRPVDTTPPTVVSVTPVGASTGVGTNSPITVTFSEALTVASVTSSTLQLRDANNNLVPATVSYNAATNTATLTPITALANSMTYVLTVVGGAGGVKDLAGNPLAANTFSSFTTVPALGTATALWDATITPTTPDSGDNRAIEVGVKFTASTDGFITGISFYKSTNNTGTHTGSLWSSTGQLLATGTFTNETASGWQTLVFDNPVAITAGTTYVASYHTNVGYYAYTHSYFASPYSSGVLTVAANGGVYSYGDSAFPTASYMATNYWVEPIFRPIGS
ncbi:MAG TPA: Ig-like domain-containing protein [Pirellulales bacterium]|nr:Ig-like domain-containing protein [Pirellulales bacterium]